MRNLLAYSIGEAARAAGFHRNTISRAIKLGRLPARRFSEKRVIILHEDLDEWLRGYPQCTGAPIVRKDEADNG
jgi:excisionase family DNA binding protein